MSKGRPKFQNYFFILSVFVFSSLQIAYAQPKTSESTIGLGWSNNSINTVIFRNSALTTFKEVQFSAYYNQQGKLVLAKRKLNSNTWETVVTSYDSNTKDAHNCISIAVDIDGYLHVSWDQHDTRLRYAKSKTPFGLDLGEEENMTGYEEAKVTYPEFHNLPNGKLLFCYRSDASGRGNMVMKSYDVKTRKWSSLQNNLIDGQNKRSAYWQIFVSQKRMYLSWVWRESWDVSTNHDICYAFSDDNGITWKKSNGEKYTLPITEATAEIAWEIPQKSSLINQSAMTVDKKGNPYIASYWSETGIPQYKVVYFANGEWSKMDTDFHSKPFYLGGGGTKSIPISRPEILVDSNMVYLLFRDEERNNRISLAYANLVKKEWKVTDLTSDSVGQWEPNFDKELWKKSLNLHIFSQKVNQVDGEGLSKSEPTAVSVLEVLKLPILK